MEQLQKLAIQGIFERDSSILTDTGDKIIAGQIPGLEFRQQFTSHIATVVENSSGNVKAFGTGQGNPAIILSWAICVISAAASFALCVYFANDLENQISGARGGLFVNQAKLNQAEQMVPLLKSGAIIVPILCLVYGAFYHSSISNTYIQVDGNGVAGKGVGMYFFWGDVRLFGFRLAYNQITSVDVSGSTIIIHASSAQYKCYVANPGEIQRVIVEQQQKRT